MALGNAFRAYLTMSAARSLGFAAFTGRDSQILIRGTNSTRGAV